MDTKLGKARNAANDALQHLSSIFDYERLECVYIDRMLAKVVDLPTDSKGKNTRRNLQMVRDWMVTDGPGVVMLEVLGQFYWRLGDLNSKDFEALKQGLHQQQLYLDLVRDPKSTAFIKHRVKRVQESKFDAFDVFIQEWESSSPSSRSTTPPRSRSTTRTRSFPPSPKQSKPRKKLLPEVNTRFKNLDEICWSFDSPIGPGPGTPGIRSLLNNDLEYVLADYYINWLCPRRTLITNSNAYVNLLAIADQSPSTLFALLSLSASYLKDCLMTDNERYQQADHYYALKAVQALGQELLNHQSTEGCLATGMLLVHHDIINETPETEVCWTCHIKMLDVLPERDVSVNYEPAVFMRYHLILASAAQSINTMRSTRPKSTKWPQSSLGYVDPESQRICPSLGLSQQLLSIIEFITTLVVDGPFIRRDYKASCAALLEDQLASLHQWTTDVSGKALEVVERTAETYRVAAQIYLQCRFVGLTRSHPTIVELNAKLHAMILSLPVAGPLYTALYPIWPLFIAAVTCNHVEMRDTLCNRVWEITSREKSNLGAVLQQISALWVWITDNDYDDDNGNLRESRRQGWWEEMLDSVKPRATLLSLG